MSGSVCANIMGHLSHTAETQPRDWSRRGEQRTCWPSQRPWNYLSQHLFHLFDINQSCWLLTCAGGQTVYLRKTGSHDGSTVDHRTFFSHKQTWMDTQRVSGLLNVSWQSPTQYYVLASCIPDDLYKYISCLFMSLQLHINWVFNSSFRALYFYRLITLYHRYALMNWTHRVIYNLIRSQAVTSQVNLAICNRCKVGGLTLASSWAWCFWENLMF